MNQYNLCKSFSFSVFFILCSLNVFAQDFPFVEISDKKKNMYQSLLSKNKQMVLFIESSLMENNLPKVMRNLALIESSFDQTTVSTAKAVGIWQFMEGHAADYGLKSKDRADVYHSTKTAMKSLKNLYAKYGNWITVVAAYNCGEGNIRKAMNKAESNKYEKFYKYLPTETRNHVYKFMQTSIVTNELDFVMKDYQLFVFDVKNDYKNSGNKTNKPNTSFLSVDINTGYDLDIIADEMNIERSELDKWNPDIENKLAKRGSTLLYLPVDMMPNFMLLKNVILNRSIQIISSYD